MKREYPDSPIVGVGGVIFKGESVLLARRDKEPGRGLWSLPGGALEVGETLTDALKREIREEASITVEVGGLIRVLDRILMDREKRVRFHYVIIDYWGWLVSGQLRAASDVSDARFVTLDEIGTMGVHREVEETIQMALALRRQHQRAL